MPVVLTYLPPTFPAHYSEQTGVYVVLIIVLDTHPTGIVVPRLFGGVGVIIIINRAGHSVFNYVCCVFPGAWAVFK